MFIKIKFALLTIVQRTSNKHFRISLLHVQTLFNRRNIRFFVFFLFLSTENVPRYYDCLFEMERPREWNFDIGIQSRRVLRWLEFCVLRFSREIGLRHWWFGTRAAMRNKLKHVRNPCWESKRFHRDIRFHGVIINIRDRSIQISTLWLKRGVMPVTIINPVWFKSEKRW